MAIKLDIPSNKAFAEIKRQVPPVAVNSFRPHIAPHSQTLAAGLKAEVSQPSDTSILIRITTGYWWAGVLDQGRKEVQAKEGRQLIWFENIKDDPRVRGGTRYPKKYAGARRLTKREYENGLEENRRRRAANQPPYMIVRPMGNGPDTSGAFAGRHFSERAKIEVGREVTEALAVILRKDLREQLIAQFRQALRGQTP